MNTQPSDQPQAPSDQPQVDLEHAMLNAIIEASKDAIICTDSSGRILSFSPGAERMFGHKAEALQGQCVDLLLPAPLRQNHAQHRGTLTHQTLERQPMSQGLVKGLRADGAEIDLQATVRRLHGTGQERLIAILSDVTPSVQADLDLQASRAELSALANKLMLQEKNLVKRIASAMHDHLGQTLATIRMVHDTMQMTATTHATPQLERLDRQLGELIKRAVQQVRQVLVDLHPPLLDESGLAAALSNELSSREMLVQQVVLSLDAPQQLATTRWPMAVEYAAFMIAREALDNALRHANASHIDIRLRGHSLLLQLEVRDNGKGCDWDDTPRRGHLGITSMRERARSIGADLVLGPLESQGWRVALTWKAAP